MSQESKTILHNEKFRLTDDGRLEVYNPRLATKINKYLRYYADGEYVFQPGEEALFRLSPAEIDTVFNTFLTRKPSPPRTQDAKLGGAGCVVEKRIDGKFRISKSPPAISNLSSADSVLPFKKRRKPDLGADGGDAPAKTILVKKTKPKKAAGEP